MEEAISNFEKNGGEYTQQIFECEKKIHSLCDELGQAESDRQQLENAFGHWKELKEVEVQELQNKLTGVIVSYKECTQLYEQLCADCTSLKADKEMALERNAELAADIAMLRAENGAFVVQKEKTKALDLIKNQLDSVHKEVRAADEDRIRASRKAGDSLSY